MPPLWPQELRRLSGDNDYAARITRAERNSHQLERNFAIVGPSKPRIAVTVDLLTTGYDAPDVKNIVFVRPLRSAILYKQMKGRGTRLCEDINKRYFTIFDYSGASQLEDAEFDGHPANQQKGALPKSKPKKKDEDTAPKPVGEGVSVIISATNRYVCLADGRKIPFEEYTEQSREFILDVSTKSLDELLAIWIDKKSRQELREELRDHDIYPSAFRHYLDLPNTDDVDILAKVGFQSGACAHPATSGSTASGIEDHGLWLLGPSSGRARSSLSRSRYQSRNPRFKEFQMVLAPPWTIIDFSALTTWSRPAPTAPPSLSSSSAASRP